MKTVATFELLSSMFLSVISANTEHIHIVLTLHSYQIVGRKLCVASGIAIYWNANLTDISKKTLTYLWGGASFALFSCGRTAPSVDRTLKWREHFQQLRGFWCCVKMLVYIWFMELSFLVWIVNGRAILPGCLNNLIDASDTSKPPKKGPVEKT